MSSKKHNKKKSPVKNGEIKLSVKDKPKKKDDLSSQDKPENKNIPISEETTSDKNNKNAAVVINSITKVSPDSERKIKALLSKGKDDKKNKSDKKSAKLESFPEVTGIVVVMIVKNESKIIHRCLNQAKPIIEGVCITDTGSTDNCIECIRKWGKENNIPCQVPVGAFKNFGYSRSLSFLNARKYFPNASYYLLLDADLNLVIEDNWDYSKLTHDGYKIYQQTKTDRYQNVRLIKANKSWVCTGVTHEYWECKGSSQDILHTLWIDDKDDGGCKQDKYSRDKRLLLEGIFNKKTPKDLKARYRFYLAQTYFCMKDYNSSIEEYQRRIDAGGWSEERFYSQLQIGKAYMASDRQELGVAALLKAWDMHPRRSEPLQIISRYYRGKSMNRLAYHFAKLASDQGYPMNDSLFIDSPTYKYLIDMELSINAFYVDKKEIGCQAHKRLKSIYKDLPSWVQTVVDGNDKFYLC
uniref:Glycosyl transferase family 2 n=1 Tax=Pithovirus LCPAC202 TaxID=2506592 RepID=A0A481Z5M0_9VIRU|nr:MAG: glycosyl transferase family 2 [Pithovirus LCPAC202]